MHRVTGENVVAMYDSGEWGETYYYSMEFVDGETLTERLIRERRIGWREVIESSPARSARPSRPLTTPGIVHRDLKPSNC